MYGEIDVTLLADAFKRITPKLGGACAKEALEALEQGDLHAAAEIALFYYDKTYTHGLKKRNAIIREQIDCKELTISECAKKLNEFLTNYIKS